MRPESEYWARAYQEYVNTPYIAGADPWDDLAMMYKGEITDPFDIDLPEEDWYEE